MSPAGNKANGWSMNELDHFFSFCGGKITNGLREFSLADVLNKQPRQGRPTAARNSSQREVD
jgi:hypothetical protein